MTFVRFRIFCAILFAGSLAVMAPVHAGSKPPKVGFDKIAARFKGGYQIVSPTGTLAGPATVRVRSSAKGRAGQVEWRNTFYNARGSYTVVLRWKFLSNGTFTANSLDARKGSLPGRGTFKTSKARLIPFTGTSTNSLVSAVGSFETRGGGSLFITVTLTGPEEDPVTYSFSGSREH